MGAFVREGTFRDRARFLEGFRAMLARLQGGTLAGLAETWEKEGDADVARLSGYGARFEFKIGPASWRCDARTPDWLPIPQEAIEAKFDEKLSGLGGL